MGIGAPLTAARFDNSVMWMGQDRRGGLTVVRSGEGFQPMMVSTPQINKLLNDRKDYVFNSHANVIRLEGHEWYILTLPGNYGLETAASQSGATDNITPITLAYDSNSKQWFKWESNDDILQDSTNDSGRWMLTASAYVDDAPSRAMNSGASRSFRNAPIVGGRDGTGEIYALRTDVYVDENVRGSEAISCERTLVPLEGPDRMRVNAGPIELVTDQDAGEDGTVVLTYAKDGKTFGSPLTRTVGAAGTSGRLMWKRIGCARRWIFKFAQDTSATGPVPVRWLRAISARLGE